MHHQKEGLLERIVYFCRHDEDDAEQFFQTLRPEGTRARVRVVNGLPANRDPALTYYDVATRAYTKTHHPDEVALNRWLFSARAKFRSHG